LHCHECGKYVQFDLDLSMDGNHVLKCPNCGHEHCRVVQKGKITDTRWDQRNGKGIAAPPPAVPSASSGPQQPTPPAQIVAPNGLPVFYVPASNVTYTMISTWATYQGTANNGNIYMYQAWMGTTCGTNFV
jgi:DNA-directed RNA polymerase subunit RPC12/RpoP